MAGPAASRTSLLELSPQPRKAVDSASVTEDHLRVSVGTQQEIPMFVAMLVCPVTSKQIPLINFPTREIWEGTTFVDSVYSNCEGCGGTHPMEKDSFIVVENPSRPEG